MKTGFVAPQWRVGIAVSHWWGNALGDIAVKPWPVVTHDRVNFHNKSNVCSLSGILFSKLVPSKYVGVTTLRGPSQYTVKGQVGKSNGKERSSGVPQPDTFSMGWDCHSKKTMLARNSQICNLYIPREVCMEACCSFREGLHLPLKIKENQQLWEHITFSSLTSAARDQNRLMLSSAPAVSKNHSVGVISQHL